MNNNLNIDEKILKEGFFVKLFIGKYKNRVNDKSFEKFYKFMTVVVTIAGVLFSLMAILIYLGYILPKLS